MSGDNKRALVLGIGGRVQGPAEGGLNEQDIASHRRPRKACDNAWWGQLIQPVRSEHGLANKVGERGLGHAHS